MSAQLIVLNTGEYIITDFKKVIETSNNEDRVAFYVFTNPRSVGVTDITFEENSNHMNSTVQLFSWPKFTKNNTVTVFPHSIISVAEPSDDLLALYQNSLK
jgi:hypothetical protein